MQFRVDEIQQGTADEFVGTGGADQPYPGRVDETDAAVLAHHDAIRRQFDQAAVALFTLAPAPAGEIDTEQAEAGFVGPVHDVDGEMVQCRGPVGAHDATLAFGIALGLGAVAGRTNGGGIVGVQEVEQRQPFEFAGGTPGERLQRSVPVQQCTVTAADKAVQPRQTVNDPVCRSRRAGHVRQRDARFPLHPSPPGPFVVQPVREP